MNLCIIGSASEQSLIAYSYFVRIDRNVTGGAAEFKGDLIAFAPPE